MGLRLTSSFLCRLYKVIFAFLKQLCFAIELFLLLIASLLACSVEVADLLIILDSYFT